MLSLDKTIYPLEVTGWVTGQGLKQYVLLFKEPFIYLQQANRAARPLMGKIAATLTSTAVKKRMKPVDRKTVRHEDKKRLIYGWSAVHFPFTD